MYIEMHDWKELEQKVLYFKLNNCFNMSTDIELSYKIAGIYAIYKDNICLYVGQSKNLASRIATHLNGKYKNSTNVYIWDIEDIGFSAYRKYDKYIQQNIIDTSEKYLMTVLKPIENLDIDMSFKPIIKYKPVIDFTCNSSLTIQIFENDIYITDNYPRNTENIRMAVDYLNIRKIITDEIYRELNDIIYNEAIKYFYTLGVENE